MGKEMGHKYYDKVFSAENSQFKTEYKQSGYYPLFLTIINHINSIYHKDIQIYEIGCGVGHIAQMLEEKGFINYYGIDFSPIGLEAARKRSNQLFDLCNIYDTDIDTDILIATEVIEHIKDDIKVIKDAKFNHLIMSLPTFDDASHVRIFKTEDDIVVRFQDILKINKIQLINRIYLIYGDKK